MRVLGVLVAGLIGTVGCASTSSPPIDQADLAIAVDRLNRASAGDMAALYQLRVARSGGLRMTVLTSGDSGRLTVSEPFGAAVSLTAWETGSRTIFFDMEEGCRREVDDLEEVLGVGALPLAQAARLLGGRLPAADNDEIGLEKDGSLTIDGAGWAATVRIAAEPWRVVEVQEHRAVGNGGWRLELDDHTSSVPGRVRLEHADGRWAELDLTRLEWPEEPTLPPLPDFPLCGSR